MKSWSRGRKKDIFLCTKKRVKLTNLFDGSLFGFLSDIEFGNVEIRRKMSLFAFV